MTTENYTEKIQRICAFSHKVNNNAQSQGMGTHGGSISFPPTCAPPFQREKRQHSFNQSLQEENRLAEHPAWRLVYRHLFPGMASSEIAPLGSAAQKRGIDRIVIMADGTQVTVQEKIRYYRTSADVLIETQHIRPDGSTWPGWIEYTQADYLLMAWLRPRRGILWRMDTIREAWRRCGYLWMRQYPIKTADSGGWRSENLAVSMAAFCEAAPPVARVDIPASIQVV